MASDAKPVFSRIMRFLVPYRWQLTGRLGLTLLNAVMGIISSYGGARVVRAATELQWSFLYMGIAILVASLVIEALTTIGGSVLMSRVSYGGIGDIKNTLITHIQRLPNRFFDRSHSGDVSSVMTNDVSAVQRFIDTRLTIYLYYPMRFLVAFGVMAFISWRLLLACCLVIPLAVLLPQLVSRRIEARATSLQAELGTVNASIQESLTGVTVIKSFGVGGSLEKGFTQHNEAALRNARTLTRLHTLIEIFSSFTWQIPQIVCILYGAWLTISGQLALYQLSFFVMSIDYLAQPIANIPFMLEAWKQTRGAAERILTLMDAPEETGGDTQTPAPDIKTPIAAEHLRFAYGDTPVLRDVSFRVPRGSTCALVGSSGSGKSTLMQILCGFYTDYDGSLDILGHPLKDWDLYALRRHVSYVSQDSYLFPTTIYDNIAMGDANATRAQVEDAARRANAHDFILLLENGYETQVGERGARLSGGQRQRITIARAMLKNAPLLFLDEPTSALDVAAEAEVQHALDNLAGGKTVLVIAHRMSTIKNADQVVVLDGGEIADIGSHTELLHRCPLYRALYDKELKLLGEEVNA